MATERRLIDASALLELVQFRLPIDNQNAEVIAGCVNITRRLIENAPTVDAVEAVHCKECKYWADGVAGCTDHVKCCKIGFYMVGENGYCVYGERRTDNERKAD